MSLDLEAEFRRHAEQYGRKRKQTLISKTAGATLLAAVVLGLVYVFAKATGVGQSPGSAALPFAITFAGAGGCVLAWRIGLLGRVRQRLGLRKKHALGYLLLLAALLYSVNPAVVSRIIQAPITRLLHNPEPPTRPSPWPWRDHNQLHPLVRTLPTSSQQSIQSVATYIVERERDPYLRAKALHDYVINHLTYDMDVLQTGQRPPQDARTVFATGKGVCEGYANLFTALAKSAGLEAATVYCKVRKDLAPIDDIPAWLRAQAMGYDWTLHAWNAIKINDQWQIVDTTWDDLDQGRSSTSYRAQYLMPAPEVMIVSHFPEQAAWQLINPALSESAFEGQPILKPRLFEENIKILRPSKQKTTVDGQGNHSDQAHLRGPSTDLCRDHPKKG